MAASWTPKPIARGTLPAVATVAYIAPANSAPQIRAIRRCVIGSDTNGYTFRVWVVPSGTAGITSVGSAYTGTPPDSALITKDPTVYPGTPADNETCMVVMEAGDALVWIASAVSAVNLYISAGEEVLI